MNNINQLKYFVEVCKYENFTKAAESLHVSQPTVTSAIKAFEREMGFQFFDRTKSHVILTENGVRMFELTQRFLEEFDNFYREACDIGIPVQTILKIGLPAIMSTFLYKKLYLRLKSSIPMLYFTPLRYLL